MTMQPRLAILIALLGVVGAYGPAQAAEPAQSDFDACNRAAQANSPSAMVGPGPSGNIITSPSPAIPTPGAPGPGLTPVPGGSMGPGVTGRSTPSDSRVAASRRSGDSLRGLAAPGMADPVYQRQYRDCLQRRGF